MSKRRPTIGISGANTKQPGSPNEPQKEFSFETFMGALTSKKNKSDQVLILNANLHHCQNNSSYLTRLMEHFKGHTVHDTLEGLHRKLTHAH